MARYDDTADNRKLKVYNILLFLCGCVLVGVASWAIHTTMGYASLAPASPLPTVVHLVLGAGLLSALIGVVGILIRFKRIKWSFHLYMVALLLAFILSLVSTVLAYPSVVDTWLLDEVTKTYPNITMFHYTEDEQQTTAIDELQTEFRCCGANSYEDWANSLYRYKSGKPNAVPDSCCKQIVDKCGINGQPVTIWVSGCSPSLTAVIAGNLLLMGHFAAAAGILQLLGLIIAPYIYYKTLKRAISDNNEMS